MSAGSAICLVTANLFGVTDRHITLALADDYNSDDSNNSYDREQNIGVQIRRVIVDGQVLYCFRQSSHNAGKNQKRNAIADFLFRNQFANPHQSNCAGGNCQTVAIKR